MNKKIIPCRVREEYVEGAGVVAGAAGSGGDAVLQLEFGPRWEGLVKYVTFRDALKENPVTVILTTDMMERVMVPKRTDCRGPSALAMTGGGEDRTGEGSVALCPPMGQGQRADDIRPYEEILIYNVPIPAKAKAVAGQMGVVVQGYAVSEDGEKVEGAVMTANAYYKILPADYAPVEDGSVTPTLSQQLQGQIEAIKKDIVGAAEAADAKEAAQRAQEAAQAAKTEAEAQAQAAERSAQAAAGSAEEAGTAAGEAKAAQAISQAAVERSEAARLGAEEARDHAQLFRSEAQTAQKESQEARDEAVLALQWIRMEQGEIREEQEEVKALGAEVRRLREETGADSRAAQEARQAAEKAQAGAETAQERAVQARLGAEAAEKKAQEWAETARDLSGGDVATRREAKGYVKAHNADPLAHEGVFPRIGFVAGERVRESWRPGYGLEEGGEEGGERSVVLEVEEYTGRGYLSAVVSGKEYDAVNLETEEEVSPNGTLIVRREE